MAAAAGRRAAPGHPTPSRRPWSPPGSEPPVEIGRIRNGAFVAARPRGPTGAASGRGVRNSTGDLQSNGCSVAVVGLRSEHGRHVPSCDIRARVPMGLDHSESPSRSLHGRPRRGPSRRGESGAVQHGDPSSRTRRRPTPVVTGPPGRSPTILQTSSTRVRATAPPRRASATREARGELPEGEHVELFTILGHNPPRAASYRWCARPRRVPRHAPSTGGIS